MIPHAPSMLVKKTHNQRELDCCYVSWELTLLRNNKFTALILFKHMLTLRRDLEKPHPYQNLSKKLPHESLNITDLRGERNHFTGLHYLFSQVTHEQPSVSFCWCEQIQSDCDTPLSYCNVRLTIIFQLPILLDYDNQTYLNDTNYHCSWLSSTTWCWDIYCWQHAYFGHWMTKVRLDMNKKFTS